MSEPDRPTSSDPSTGPWHDQDDPEATRVVRRNPPADGDDGEATQFVSDAQPESAGPAVSDSSAGDGTASTATEGAAASGTHEQSWPTPGPAVPEFGGNAPASSPEPNPVTGPSAPAGPASGAQPGAPVTGPSAPAGPASGAQPSFGATPSAPTPQPAAGPGSDADPTMAMPPSGVDPQATSYIGAPTAGYPGPGTTGPQPFTGPPAGYSYQQPGYGSGPQTIAPPATANVALPPVRMPKAESRVAVNILGSIVGLILVLGGVTLVALYAGKMRAVDATSTDPGSASLDVLSVVLVIVGAVLIATAALLAAWASWSAILPGFLLSAASIWAMITTGQDSGAVLINEATSWAFKDGQFAYFTLNGIGLMVGLLLFAAGLAAVFLRAGVRRTIRQQLESIQT